LAGLKPSNKKPASVKTAAVASAAEEHHAKEYQKIRRKVIEKYAPTFEDEMESLIQRDFKWNLVSRTYVQRTLTEQQDIEAYNLSMSGSALVSEGEGESRSRSGSGKKKRKERGWDL
jgi:hypothetical protein